MGKKRLERHPLHIPEHDCTNIIQLPFDKDGRKDGRLDTALLRETGNEGIHNWRSLFSPHSATVSISFIKTDFA